MFGLDVRVGRLGGGVLKGKHRRGYETMRCTYNILEAKRNLL
jgi:hypothetical protein